MPTVAFLMDEQNDWLDEYIQPSSFGADSYEGRYEFVYTKDAAGVHGFDVVFILGYTKILQGDFLDRNGLCLVVHESALPQGRGFSPVQYQVLEGKNTIPVCLIEAISELDAGDIIGQTVIELTGYELFDEIRRKQAEATLTLIDSFLKEYPDYTRRTQEGSGSSYKRRTEKDDCLDADRTLNQLFGHLRIADNENYPIFFEKDGQRYYLKIYRDKK